MTTCQKASGKNLTLSSIPYRNSVAKIEVAGGLPRCRQEGGLEVKIPQTVCSEEVTDTTGRRISLRVVRGWKRSEITINLPVL